MSTTARKNGRMFIYATDVVVITGRSYKTALKILNEVRKMYEKPAEAMVSYKEFSACMHLDEEEVFRALQ